ncbi:metal-sulfur cluster biosynthetic enzyme [Haladaptatus sp. W1]|uniref:iron-sulfur cluster assembly protein n=1 Tax=Haladaptatus sp. W1 TaxID=1897478 RepID=UPI0008497291|nr:iron-sulfur cluster assembly protein [Haladaptatus sp. W1]ODR82392.1 metal-sulfur cluster biosynthetic enzyme [Haladaptatus sp. W1]
MSADDSNSDGSERDGGRNPTRAAVRSALDEVTDPELDRSIVELEYIDDIAIEPGEPTDLDSAGDLNRSDESGAHVEVSFTLPTAWCSPAFAWMMAIDGREAVESLPGVARCEMHLNDHMHASEVTEGVNGGRGFEETFPDADGGIEATRATLDSKARLARQYVAVEALLAAGVTHEQIAAMSRGDCHRLPGGESVAIDVRGGALAVVVDADPLDRYLAKAEGVGCFADGDDRLFRTPEGDPIDPDRAELVHRRARLARVNMDGQGGVCAALHEARRSESARR